MTDTDVNGRDPQFLHPDLFADPRVRSTITGGYLVTVAGVAWMVARARGGGWTASPEPGQPGSSGERIEHHDVNQLVTTLLEGDD
jgi:hypothetical protein